MPCVFPVSKSLTSVGKMLIVVVMESFSASVLLSSVVGHKACSREMEICWSSDTHE